MPVIRHPQIAGAQALRHLLYFAAVPVVADIDMDFPFLRIFQKGTCVDCLVQEFRSFIVGGDEYIYIREPCIRDIRQRDLVTFPFHPARHQLDHAAGGHGLCCCQHYSCRCLQDPGAPRDCKEDPPDQVNRRQDDRQYKTDIPLPLFRHCSCRFSIDHDLLRPFSCYGISCFSGSDRTGR